MKTPTLIVRLAGLYLLVNCGLTLRQLHSLSALGPVGPAQQSTLGDIQLYALLGLIVGLTGTLFAGLLARLLTFDAQPRVSQSEITGRLLDRKS
jgi:H+/Cl- antiporter ClcA